MMMSSQLSSKRCVRQPAGIILSAYSLVQKLAVSVVSKPNWAGFIVPPPYVQYKIMYGYVCIV